MNQEINSFIKDTSPSKRYFVLASWHFFKHTTYNLRPKFLHRNFDDEVNEFKKAEVLVTEEEFLLMYRNPDNLFSVETLFYPDDRRDLGHPYLRVFVESLEGLIKDAPERLTGQEQCYLPSKREEKYLAWAKEHQPSYKWWQNYQCFCKECLANLAMQFKDADINQTKKESSNMKKDIEKNIKTAFLRNVVTATRELVSSHTSDSPLVDLAISTASLVARQYVKNEKVLTILDEVGIQSTQEVESAVAKKAEKFLASYISKKISQS